MGAPSGSVRAAHRPAVEPGGPTSTGATRTSAPSAAAWAVVASASTTLHVRVPGRCARHAGRRCRDRRDVEAVQAGDEVLVVPRWQLVLELPAEDPTVELGRRLGIGLLGVDQARDAGRVLGAVDERVDRSCRHHDAREVDISWPVLRAALNVTGIGRAAQWGAPRVGYVQVDGARLYYRDVGTRRPILVLHGGPDFDHHYLLPEMDRLADSFRLIYDDQHGRGRSAEGVRAGGCQRQLRRGGPRPRSKPPRVGTRRPPRSLVWGGVLAMEYATRHPERVSRLILMNTAPGSA